MRTVRSLLLKRSCCLHVVPFGDRPGKLFDGLENCRSVIFLSAASDAHGAELFTTRYQRWATEARPFLAYFIAYGDCFHLSDNLVTGFPIPKAILSNSRFERLGKELLKSLTDNAVRKTIQTRDGSKIAYAEFYCSSAKCVVDEIDMVLAEHYGFSREELDFMINYDIKYRLGQEDEEEDE